MLEKKQFNKLFPDALIAISITIITFLLFILFDATEKWFYLTRKYETHELDETIGLLLGALIGLLYFTGRLHRRYRKHAFKIYRLSRNLEFEVSFDHLTSLPNRRSFEKHIRDLIVESTEFRNRFTLLYIDLDCFKYINDTLGHSVGDKLLIIVSKRLAAANLEGATLSRVGGDEFCMVKPGYTSNQDCLALCNMLNKKITEPILIDGQKLYVSQTIGISRFPEDGKSYEQLLSVAHIAMYMGKKPGQRRNNFKDRDFMKDMKMRFIIQHGLQDAVNRKQFYVEYQPKINLQNSELVGSEALVRWKHPKHGFIAPNKFIYIAEETHIVHLIDFFVLETVCKQLQAWGDLAKPVAVNLSPVLFADENIVTRVLSILAKYKISPHLIELEITERTMIAESEIPLRICQRLADNGISLSLDDFGTGYSSLSHIADFPISTLKIDKAFINQICQNERTKNIVAAIISLAKALSIKVIAEGIETHEQRELMRTLKCHEAQGYYFDKPLTQTSYLERLLHADGQTLTP